MEWIEDAYGCIDGVIQWYSSGVSISVLVPHQMFISVVFSFNFGINGGLFIWNDCCEGGGVVYWMGWSLGANKWWRELCDAEGQHNWPREYGGIKEGGGLIGWRTLPTSLEIRRRGPQLVVHDGMGGLRKGGCSWLAVSYYYMATSRRGLFWSCNLWLVTVGTWQIWPTAINN